MSSTDSQAPMSSDEPRHEQRAASASSDAKAQRPEGASEPEPKPKGRLQKLFAEYGAIGIGTYFAIFALTWAGFAGAIAFGFQIEGAAGGAGTAGASYLATKLTQPLRIAATFVLTPAVAAVWSRVRPPTERSD